MIQTGPKEKRRWGLKPIILAWIIPILLANFFLGVLLNYLMARENDSRRIQDHILQRRMDLVFLTHLPHLRMYLMDLKLGLAEEADFVKDDLQIYLANYLKNLKPSFSHNLSVLSLQGQMLIRIKNGEISSELRRLDAPCCLERLKLVNEKEYQDLPLPVFSESSWSDNLPLVDVFPIFDEVNHQAIGGIIYEYYIPLQLLTQHTSNVLLVNLGLGFTISLLALAVINIALGNIIQPLNRLTVASQEILTGDLSQEIQVQGWGETRLLAATFEAMRQRLKKQFEQLEDTTRNLEAIIDFLPDATFIIDRNRKVLFWNKAIEEMTGCSRETMLGRADMDCAVPFYKKKRPMLISLAFATALQQQHLSISHANYMDWGREGNIFKGAAWCSTIKGEQRLIAGTASVLYDEHGEIWGGIESLRDITDFHETVQEKEKLQAQLYQSQKMEAIGRLAGGIAHDFNNLLTVISGYTEVMKMNLGQDDIIKQNAEDILQAANRAASLTGQLLAFSRKQILQPQVVNLNKVVTGIEQMLQRLIGEDIDMLSIFDPNLGAVKVDPGQIEQVILNLVVNARDAMPQGGKLTIETGNVHLDANAARRHPEISPGSYVMLAVSDNGMGMDTQTQANIFEPFFTTKEVDKGTGLGLATVHGIVKQSNGYIWIYSEPGQGTTFKIYFPRVEEPCEVIPAKIAAVEAPPGNETILVVEDNDALRALISHILNINGYTVLEAANGNEAIRLVEDYQKSIHLMITDVVMPEMRGDKLAAYLQPLLPHLQVLYMSGYTDNAIVHQGILDPGLAFIPKPFRLPDLLSKVREILNAKPQS